MQTSLQVYDAAAAAVGAAVAGFRFEALFWTHDTGPHQELWSD